MLGLFSYTVLVRDMGLGRCILAASSALAIMILPFIEVRAEKAFREVPELMVQSAYALGCSRAYTIRRVVFPACRGEMISGMILGGCYAMGATAPVMFTGAVAYASVPQSLLSPAMSLPLHLYLLLSQGATSMPAVYGTAFVMMVIILVGNLAAALYAEHRALQEAVEPVKRKNERENKMESNMNDAIMQICNLNVSYDGKTVLHNVSMNIRRNRITAILGPSGCGKTTFLKTLNGLLE